MVIKNTHLAVPAGTETCCTLCVLYTHELLPCRYDVIDGKQRLTSILTFYLGDSMGWASAPVTLGAWDVG